MSIDKLTEIEQLKTQIAQLEANYREAQDRIAALQVIHDVARSLTAELNLDPLLHKILGSAVEVMHASAGSLLLLDELADELEFAVVEGGGGPELIGVRMQRDKGIAGWVATHRQPLIVDDVNVDDRYYQSIANTFDFKPVSLLCVPMIARTSNKLIGVLQILRSTPGYYFGELDQQLLITFATQAASAIENARLYESLKDERDHLIVVEDEVRKRLARDLHDGPAQLLASIVMSLSFTRQLLKRDPEQALDEIEQNTIVAERALKQLRTLLFDLRPVILETQGLISALEVYAERLSETEVFEVILIVNQALDRLSPHAEEGIFAIVQEAVNNAKKHANASQIQIIVNLEHSTDTLAVTIKDNGLGFDLQQAKTQVESRGNMGLLNMQERADTIKGTLRVHSHPEQGTEIILNVPFTANLPRSET